MSIKTILFILLIFIALTGCNQQPTPPANQDIGTRSLWGNLDDQLADATVADLIPGAKVMVMGKNNTDGSVAADRIIIGDFDFGQFGPPAGGANTNRQFRRNSEMARASGEVLSLADNRLVIKLDDGGSKIVFLSEATVIKKGKK